MASSICEPTLQGIPAELREKIFEHLFANIEFHTGGTVTQIKDFDSRTHVLQVDNEDLHREALYVLEKELTIHTNPLSLASAAKYGLKAHSIQMTPTRSQTRRPCVAEVRHYFPTVRLITFKELRPQKWLGPMMRWMGWHDVFSMISGEKDDMIVELLSDRFIETHRVRAENSCPPNPFTSPDGKPCRVVLNFPTLGMRWSNTGEQNVLDPICRISVDLTKSKVISREFNLEYHKNTNQWVPANRVVILREGLSRPVLYRSDTGEVRVLLEAGETDTWDLTPDEMKAEIEASRQLGEPLLDYEKRGKILEYSDPRTYIIRKVERQLADKSILQRAMASAKPCYAPHYT